MDYVILLDLFCIFLIIATPIFMQRTAYQTIHENKFKLIKLEKIGFLFKGMQGQSATSHGVILPMLMVQIQGYILGILALIFLVCVLEFEFVDITVASLIIIATLFIHCFICIAVTVIAGFIGKKDSQQYHSITFCSKQNASFITNYALRITHCEFRPQADKPKFQKGDPPCSSPPTAS